MPIQTLGELWTALAAGDWERLVGTEESSTIEFKSGPYRLSENDKDKWELAKDVASLANEQGGVIVIGFRTTKDAAVGSDVVAEHRPVNRDLVNVETITKVLQSRIYPRVRGVVAKWFPENSEHGVLVLEIPSQESRDKPFLLEGSLSDDGKLHSGTIAWPFREGGNIEWTRAATIQHLLSGGRTRTDVPTAYERDVVERLQQFSHGNEIWKTLIAMQQWNETSLLLLQAIPPLSARRPLPRFFSDGGIASQFRRYQPLRENGFTFVTRAPADDREGAVTLLRDPRKAAWLEPDGSFSVGGIIDGDFLGWAFNDDEGGGPIRMNPFALAEFVLEFTRFVHTVLVPAVAGEWMIRARGTHLRAPRGTALREGLGDRWMGPDWSVEPPDNADSSAFSAASAEEDSFRLLEWFYGLYGLSAESLDFVKSGRVVASDFVIRAGR